MRPITEDSEFRTHLEHVRDCAVAAVMRGGRFEASGDTRLAVLRLERVMIAYRTPFNPLPRLSEQAKYIAAREGKSALLKPYGIDIWQANYGRVLSIGWQGNGPVVVDIYRPGRWERLFDDVLIRDAEPARNGRRGSTRRGAQRSSPAASAARSQKMTRPA